MSQPDEPWYVRAFGADYLALYAHRSDHEARTQVAAMLKAGLLGHEGHLLDLCCGAGRHLHAFRSAGLKAWGLDLSQELLRAGTLGGLAVRADVRRIPFADGVFETVVNLFTSFGYFDHEDAHLAMLNEIRRVLHCGGRLVLDTINPRPAVAAMQPEDIRQTFAGQARIKRRYEALSRCIIKEIELTPPSGPPRRWSESVRVFEPAELDSMLVRAKFGISGRYADLSGEVFDEGRNPRQVVIAIAKPER